MPKSIKIFSLIFVFIFLFAVTPSVLAYYYDVTIPRLGGSTTTYNVTKSNNGGNGYINSYGVGGGYTVNARFELIDNTSVSPYFPISTGTYISHPLSQSAGTIMHLRLKNGTWTWVSVQATGDWSPN